jgi:DNA recombination protein RmuC
VTNSVAYLLLAAVVLLGLFLGGAIMIILRRLAPKPGDGQALLLQQQMQSQMQNELQALRGEMARALSDSSRQSREQISVLTAQLNERMKETSLTLQNTQATVGERLDNAANMVGMLQRKLGQIEESNKKIFDLGQGLQELKDILKNPKLRGNMGEFFLEDLMRQILPPEHYRIQHCFKSGEIVDCAINLGDAMVSIDSKFPLESFVRMVQIPEDQVDLKRREKRSFVAAIKKHADAISKKYILPDEGTFDFALMYIPAENIYYETIIRDDMLEDEGSLYSYLLSKKVIPVSPNSLYAYLQVIVLGLKGLRVQEHARQIINDLQRVEGDLGKFREDYTVLGKHLKNAQGSYEESTRRLDKFQSKVEKITDVGDRLQQLPGGAEAP